MSAISRSTLSYSYDPEHAQDHTRVGTKSRSDILGRGEVFGPEEQITNQLI